jgi:hypothetical protein
MKITIGKLKSLIRESILDEHHGGKPGISGNRAISFINYPLEKYDPMTWTSNEIYLAVMMLFEQVATDLGITSEDPSDPRFIDHLCDTLSDHKVPHNIIDQVEERLQNRKFGRGDFNQPLNF